MAEKKNDDAKAKFLEALAKKQNKGTGKTEGGTSTGSKIGGSQNGSGAPKMFRRKSGPS